MPDLTSAAMQHFMSNALGDARTTSKPSERNRVVEEWVPVEDPLEAAHSVVAHLFEEPTRAGRRAAAKRKRAVTGWGIDADGADTFCGKVCCAQTALDATRRGLRTRNWYRSPDYTADAVLCALCDGPASPGKLCCGVAPRRNDELVCRSCLAVYKRQQRTVPV